MLTEYQALCRAKEYAWRAMNALEQYSGGSYYCDEAHGKLEEALGALVSGLRQFEVEDEAVGQDEAVETPGGTQGESEGVPETLLDGRPLYDPTDPPSNYQGQEYGW